MFSIRCCPLLLASVATLGAAPGLAAQCQLTWQPAGSAGVVGAVNASVEWDPDGAGPAAPVLVVAGQLTAAGGQPVAGIAQWDPATATWSPLGTGVTGEPFALATFGGDLVVAGDLTAAGGVPVDSVARWDGSAWSPLGSGLDGAVYAMIVRGNGDLVIGGDLTSTYATGLEHVARWNGTAWVPLGAGLTARVTAFAELQNGELVAGYGPYLSYGRSFVSRWDGTTWNWLGTARGSGNTSIRALEVLPNGDLLAGGRFDTMSQIPAAQVARWNGSTWSAMPVLQQSVHDFAQLPGGRLLAATAFAYGTTPNPSPEGIVEWTGNGWTPVGESADFARDFGRVAALTLYQGALLAAGSFNGVSVRSWNGASWDGLGAGPDRAVAALTVLADGGVLGLTTSGRSLLRFDGVAWSPVTPATDGPIEAVVELPNGDLVIAGDFGHAGAVPASRIARWDGAAFHPLGAGLADRALALAVLPGGDLVAAGRFTQAGGVAVNMIARWNGQTWSALGNPVFFHGSPITHLLVTPDGSLYAARRGVLRWDGNAWSDTNAAQTGYDVTCLARVLGNKVAVARAGFVGTVEVWDGAAWSGLVSVNGRVHAIASEPDGTIVVGGEFAWLAGVAANGVARSSPGGWLPVGSGIVGEVLALAWDPDGALLAGGDFDQAGSVPSAFCARLATTCGATAAAIPTACAGSQGPLVLDALGLPWAGTTFRSRASGFAPGAFGLALLGLSSPAVPLTALWPVSPAGCDQLASLEAVVLALPQGGAAGYSFAIPGGTTFAGLDLYHQFLQFEIGASNAVLTGSNGLSLRIGHF